MAKTPDPDPETPDAGTLAGKGRATPTRREKEAARKRPLVPDDRREAAKAERARRAEVREKARIGMANGDERYMTARDKGPQRKYVRDYVDARFSVGEIVLPLLALFVVTYIFPQVAEIALYAMWTVILIVIIDGIILGRIITRKVGAKFGESKVEKGLRWYAFMRAVQLRPIRLPKPQVKRGQYPG